MQRVSATYDRLKNSRDKYYKTRLVIEGAGVCDEDVLFSIDTSSQVFSKTPEVGKVISAEIDASLLNPYATIPPMAKVEVFVKLCGYAPESSGASVTGENIEFYDATVDGENIAPSQSSGAAVTGENLSFAVDVEEYAESEWLPQGVFYIDTRDVTKNENDLEILTFHGFDAMLKTEQDYAGDAVGGDYDTAYVKSIADQIGVDVDERTWEIMQGGRYIPFPLGYSCREILGMIAMAYIGFFIITEQGKLRLVSLLGMPTETNLLITEYGDAIEFGGDCIFV